MTEEQVLRRLVRAWREMTEPSIQNAAWAIVSYRRKKAGEPFSRESQKEQDEAADVADRIRANEWPLY